MRHLLLSTAALMVWQGFATTQADDFAAVPGTGWTDISQLSSTCDIPGYFVNSADCSRFYICVNHSTPQHRLYLRYDFDCPQGLAFDASKKICDYPGPTGCVSEGGSGGGGWGGWQQPTTERPGWGWGNPGIFQSTSTSSKAPSWGTPTRNPVVPGSGTIVRVNQGISGGGGVIRYGGGRTSYPANPQVNLPTPVLPQWESYRIQAVNPGVFQSAKVTQGGSGGWESNRIAQPLNPGVFQSARLTPNAPNSVAWGSSKVFPVQPGVFQSNRVTQVPQAEWEVPKEFPTPPQTLIQHTKVVEGHSGSWQSDRGSPAPANPAIRWDRIRAPAPANPSGGWESNRVSQSPAPANPSVGWETLRVSQGPAPANPSVSWDGIRVSPSPAPANPSVGWETVRVTPSPLPANPSGRWEGIRVSPSPAPANPSIGWETIRASPSPPPQQVQWQGGWNSPEAANPSFKLRGPPGGGPAPANPSLNLVNGSGTWVNGNVRITQIPSGYAWQTTSVVQDQQQQPGVPVSTPATSEETSSTAQGNFGIVQQVIDEQRQVETGKSHIQQIYENKEKQSGGSGGGGATTSIVENQTSSQQLNSPDLSASLYQIIASRNSAVKGRIIVLYAPLNSAGKREVPVVEVQVENTDDSRESAENQQ